MKVLIVDDEKRIGLLIQNLIHWEELGLTFAGFASNGKEALSKIEAEQPDVVISDIRMPEMNGLELIRRVREKGMNTYFIVITGYKDFDYIHTAMKLGVEDFLLKPIREEELNTALQEVLEKANAAPAPEETQSGEGILSPTALEYHERLEEGLEELNRAYGLQFRPGLFQCMVIRVEQPAFIINRFRPIMQHICQCVQDTLSPVVYALYTIQRQANTIVVETNYSREQAEDLAEALPSLQKQIVNLCSRYDIQRFVIGVGTPQEDIREFPLSYRMAQYASRSVLVLGANCIIDARTLHSPSHSTYNRYRALDDTATDELSRCIQVQDAEACGETLSNMFKMAAKGYGLYPGIAHENYQQVARFCYLRISQLGLLTPLSAGNQASLLHVIDNCLDGKEVESALIEYLKTELCQVRDSQNNVRHQSVILAEQYINEHYNENVTLEQLAEIAYMNADYLSALFKRETGQNFNKYLLNVRINQAKMLLKDNRYSLSQVAAMVGYKDAKYFSKQFTKITGLRPKEYRQLSMSNLV